jgi:FkbM family methyltransferase
MRPYYYLGDHRALTQLANGQPFFVNTRDIGITTWIILGGAWEHFVDDILCGVTRADDRVLDAGANQGYYSVKLGRIVGPDGRIVAFEPNPELYELLESNLDINGFGPRSLVFRQALGAVAGNAELRFSYRNMGGGSLAPHLADGQEAVRVEVVRGDDVLPPDTVFDVMKFDVEGFEPEAAEGLTGVLARSPHAAIVVEISPQWWSRGPGPAPVLARFAVGGKEGFEIAHDGLLTPLSLHDPQGIAGLQARGDSFYMLLLPAQHWAMDFVRSKCRTALQ